MRELHRKIKDDVEIMVEAFEDGNSKKVNVKENRIQERF